MNKLTTTVPNVGLENFKHTKIVATIGPATNSFEGINALIRSGANGLRLNFSHGTHEERTQQIKWIREASYAYGKPVSIIQDLQGPKIRLGDFEDNIQINKGEEYIFGYKSSYSESGVIPTQYDLSKKMKTGERLYLYDGRIQMEVTDVKSGKVYARANNSGEVIRRKGINLPDTDFGGDIITDKDHIDIKFGAKTDMDYVALSFVQTAEDIKKLKKILAELKSQAKVIAKIETSTAVKNIEEIVKAADVVMVARGDLAIETKLESVPVVQRKIVKLGRKYAKPTIVATQMLASMADMPEPTRAEVSDVSTAVFIGADAVMLSDETANGQHPIEAVRVMKRIILYSERSGLLDPVQAGGEIESAQNAISKSIITLSSSIKARAIVAETKSGATALQVASHRPELPIIAVTNDKLTAQHLAIVFGVKSYIRPAKRRAAEKLTDWLRQNDILQSGDVVVSASGQHPGVVGTTDTIKVRVLK